MAEEKKQEQQEEFHSVWDKQGINDLPTLMNTAMKLERPQGGGFFTEAYNKWMDAARNEFYESVEKNPELKRYYMPEERESITNEDIQNKKKEISKTSESIEKSKQAYIEKFGKVENGQVSVDPDKVNEAARQAQGQNKKGTTPRSIFKMITEYDSNVAEFDKKKASVQAKGAATVVNMMKEQRLASDIPLARATALRQEANRYADEKFWLKNKKTQMITSAVADVGKTVSNIGGTIAYGRNYRKG